MGEVFLNRMSPEGFASLSHITNLINSIASGSLLQVHFFDVVVRLSFFNLSIFLNKIYLWLCCWVFIALHGLSLVPWSTGFSREWFILWSTGFMLAGFCSCGSQDLEHRLSSCGARA